MNYWGIINYLRGEIVTRDMKLGTRESVLLKAWTAWVIDNWKLKIENDFLKTWTALLFGYGVRNLLDYSAIIERILRYTQNDKGFIQIFHFVQYDRVIKHVWSLSLSKGIWILQNVIAGHCRDRSWPVLWNRLFVW